jgi:hypothetical protein
MPSFLLRAVAFAGPEADPNIVAMTTALDPASAQWLQKRRQRRSSAAIRR